MRDLSAQERRAFLERKLKISLKKSAQFGFNNEKVLNRNIENLIGATQVPLGIAGPMRLRTSNLKPQTLYLPLATTEGALVASVNRGCKATRLVGGISVWVENAGATRAPVFRIKNIEEGEKLIQWVRKHFKQLKKMAEKADPYLKLLEVQPAMVGRNVYLRFVFDTCEAMGMNMVTFASERITQLIKAKTKIECFSLTGNLCVDKKPAWLNFIRGRGKRVWTEVKIKKEVVKKVLKTTPEKIAEVVYRKCLLGSAMAGSVGFNGHYANIVAALFLATGQDMAHVVEGSLGITTAEVIEKGSLYFSVYLPDLMIGTVGGGTHLPTQKEALSVLGLGKGKRGEALKFAEIIGGAVLAGELSLMAALASGDLARAHEKLGRGGRSGIARLDDSFDSIPDRE